MRRRLDRFVSSPLVRRATEAILLGLLLVQVAVVALKTDFYQYDFRAYYLGPRLLWSGQDPYSMAALTERAEALGLADNNHPFIYAPYMLLVFGAIAWLPYKLAYWLWLTFQVAICVAIFRLTKRRLGVSATMLMFLGALGLNGTTAACLRAGQLSLLLTLLVLLAITSLLDRKPGHSSAFVFVAAAIKLWPISFGGLRLFGERGRWVSRVAPLLGLGLLLASSKALVPKLWSGFGEAVRGLSSFGHAPEGAQDGSLLNLINSIVHSGLGIRNPTVVTVVWLLTALGIGGATLARVHSGVKRNGAWSLELGLAAVLAVILALPRVVVYEWVLLIPAFAYVIEHRLSLAMRWVVLVIAAVPFLYVNRYLLGVNLEVPIEHLWQMPFAFSNVLLAIFVWVVLMRSPHASVETARELSEPLD